MQKSYTKNYIKIYFWQILSIVLNLLSLVIVIPKLTSRPDIYGIYSICVSSVIFLSYADLGFVNAGYKYASEYYAKGDKAHEIRIIGFVGWILLMFVLVFSAVIIVLSFHPAWLIKNLTAPAEVSTARYLLLILAIFAPNVVLQRALMIIFGVRLEDYINQRINIIVSLCKILSVFYFFRTGQYDIVSYFLFCQGITTAGYFAGFYIAGRRYQIRLLQYLKDLRFTKLLYGEMKSLALSTFFVTLSWILYYELDIYVIARVSGAGIVAYYAIGLTCLSFFRSILGAMFNPFTARFNHFIALNDDEGLRNIYKTVLHVMLPIVVFPIIAIAGLSKPFVLSWVGNNFTASIPVVCLLVLSNILAFLNYPSGMLMVAKKNIKAMYALAVFQPVCYWVGIGLTYPHFGFIVFGWFTFISFMISGAFYLWVSLQFLEVNVLWFLRRVIWPALIPVLLVLGLYHYIAPYLPHTQSKGNLLTVVAVGGAGSALGVMIYYITSIPFRNYINSIYFKFRPKSLPAIEE